MSQDIRSMFSAMAKKAGGLKPKKPVKILDSDDEDIVENTPEKTAVKQPVKRRAHVLSSDSEEDGKAKKKSSKSPSQKAKGSSSEKKKAQSKKDEKPNLKKLKPVDIDFFNKPIKQTQVKQMQKEDKSSSKDEKTKIAINEGRIHNDKAFEETLKHLDEDDGDDTDDTILLDNLDLLDKTIEEAMKADEENTAKKSNKKSKTEVLEKKVKEEKITPKKRPRKTSESTPTPKKKQKLEQTDSGIDEWAKIDRKYNAAGMYAAYLHRGGPKNHGEKVYPKGNPDCLKNLTFLRTGVLDSLEGDEFETLVTDHGGRVVHGVSKKVNFMVVGDQPGPAKLEKSRKYGIPEIDEDQFLDMILVKSGQQPRYAEKGDAQSDVASEDLGIGGSEDGGSPKKKLAEEELYVKKESTEGIKEEALEEKVKPKKIEKVTPELVKIKEEVKETGKIKEDSKETVAEPVKVRGESVVPTTENLSWTEKYKPTDMTMIIGQQHQSSNMNKLKNWLQNWFKNANPEIRKKLPRPNLYNQFDGSWFKAALLNGSPGVGKTTTATIVAKALGFDIVEFNASDTRNKKLLHEEISHMMGSKTLAGFTSQTKDKTTLNQKRVLLMDEVDGMAGNEDRGGIAELINFIKTAKFPIICMCNNKDLQKMRTLVTHCYTLNFEKPKVAQIRGAMMSVCFKEGLKIKPDALAQLIEGTGCDIRQTLNHLAMWSAAKKDLSSETVAKESKNSQKDVVFGAWDVTKKVFNKQENKDMSLVDKSRLFFYDYSFLPMFVQENYLFVEPECTGSMPKNLEILLRRQKTAESLSVSDLIESKIRSTNNWSLLESQAFYSTVFPSYYMSGNFNKVRFPSWFGKNSQRTKSLRIIGEVHAHARTSISGDKVSVRLDYAEPLLKKLLTPIQEKQEAGIADTLDVMKSYSLLRDDLTNLCELMSGFRDKKANPFDSVSSKVKAALTRTYNKTMTLNFAPPTASKKKKGGGDGMEDLLGEEAALSDDEDENDDNVDTDALVKVKTKASTSKASEGKAKGKAKDTKGTKGKNRK
ncbi:replication factor C subunit 1 [Anthonomus grandis grandis]|uniref:replication factor C subunit 1 n=1 Tax=Anthonomus grandis grandis TaxID=2921223 RepID=UPI0021662EB8|nr:replication factor C subunit 1 [Anthonomus grandis grandis]